MLHPSFTRIPPCLEIHLECHEMTTSQSQSLGRKVHQAFQVLASLGWGNESEQKAEKEPRMGKSLLILFSYKLPVTHSFISKLRPHSSKKESRRMQGPLLSECVCVCGRGRWALEIYKILDLHQNNRVLKVHTRSRRYVSCYKSVTVHWDPTSECQNIQCFT